MSQDTSSSGSSGGISVAALAGCALAGYCSYTLGNPIGWVAINAIFGWFYLLYLCAGCGGGLPGGLF
jgi:hypothetical protein